MSKNEPVKMSLRDKAKAKLTFSFGHLNCEGMTKLETEDILGKPVTIVDFDWSKPDRENGTSYPVIIFKEYDNCFYFGGLVLADLLADIGGDDDAMQELTKDGLPIKLSMVKGKNKREYAKVEII